MKRFCGIKPLVSQGALNYRAVRCYGAVRYYRVVRYDDAVQLRGSGARLRRAFVKKRGLADRVESTFLWNKLDRMEYSGQGEELADRGRN